MSNPLKPIQGTKLGGILRTVGLWILILCSAGMLFWFFASGELIWLETMAVIAIWIVWREIRGVFIGYRDEKGKLQKITISEAAKRYIQRWGWAGLVPFVLFIIAMVGFFLHAIAWG